MAIDTGALPGKKTEFPIGKAVRLKYSDLFLFCTGHGNALEKNIVTPNAGS